MSIQKTMTNNDRKKRGGIFLAIAAACFLIYLILPASYMLDSKAAVIIVTFIRVVDSFGMLIFFFAGLYYLIKGFTTKE